MCRSKLAAVHDRELPEGALPVEVGLGALNDTLAERLARAYSFCQIHRKSGNEMSSTRMTSQRVDAARVLARGSSQTAEVDL